MERQTDNLVCRICGVEVTSDLEMIKHITENHSDPQTSGSQGKEPRVKMTICRLLLVPLYDLRIHFKGSFTLITWR